MTALAWVIAGALLAAFTVTLYVGDACATIVGPYMAVALVLAWAWLAYRYERRGR